MTSLIASLTLSTRSITTTTSCPPGPSTLPSSNKTHNHRRHRPSQSIHHHNPSATHSRTREHCERRARCHAADPRLDARCDASCDCVSNQAVELRITVLILRTCGYTSSREPKRTEDGGCACDDNEWDSDSGGFPGMGFDPCPSASS